MIVVEVHRVCSRLTETCFGCRNGLAEGIAKKEAPSFAKGALGRNVTEFTSLSYGYGCSFEVQSGYGPAANDSSAPVDVGICCSWAFLGQESSRSVWVPPWSFLVALLKVECQLRGTK